MVGRTGIRLTTTGLVLALLAGCGGGGDGGSSSAPVQVTAPPVGTPAPPPAPPTAVTYPPAPSGVTSATEFMLFGFSSNSPSSSLQPSDVSLRWLGSPATYQLRVAGVGEGELRQWSATDRSLRLVDRNGAVLLQSLDVPRPLARYSGVLRSYSTPNFETLFGVATIASAVPSTGTRTYANVGSDHGTPMRITLDFAARRVTGTIDIAWSDAWGPYPPTRFNLTPTVIPAGAVEFSVPIEVPGAPSPGTLSARFSGPNGEELLVAWRAPVRNPYDNRFETFTGVQVAG